MNWAHGASNCICRPIGTQRVMWSVSYTPFFSPSHGFFPGIHFRLCSLEGPGQQFFFSVLSCWGIEPITHCLSQMAVKRSCYTCYLSSISIPDYSKKLSSTHLTRLHSTSCVFYQWGIGHQPSHILPSLASSFMSFTYRQVSPSLLRVFLGAVSISLLCWGQRKDFSAILLTDYLNMPCL